jgi:hypothetical protein
MPGFYLLISAPGAVGSADDAAKAVAGSGGHRDRAITSSLVQAEKFSNGVGRRHGRNAHVRETKQTSDVTSRSSVPPNQQGPICLESCADPTIRSHWLMRNVSKASQRVTSSVGRAASSGRPLKSSRRGGHARSGSADGRNGNGDGDGDGAQREGRASDDGNIGVGGSAGSVQIVLAADPAMCLEITGPHEVRDGGLDLRPCNASAPLQGWVLHDDGGLETTATADELASVNVGTPTCQCDNGRFVDVNAHSPAPDITLQM